ncbi:MAG: pknB 12 [Phycisphaerales bacterium]|nr:pknB 12 [Phycisphaerales bacterium]
MRHGSLAIAAVCGLFLFAASAFAGVEIAKTNGEARHVKAEKYEADIAADGALSSLKVKGQEMLKPGVGVSRGAYCFQHGAVALTKIEQPNDTTVVAKADGKPSVTYEFSADAIALSVANTTATDLQFVFVLDPAVGVVMSDRGEMMKMPIKQSWSDTAWFAGDKKLQVAGANKIWGPYMENTGVIEADLKPGETRKILVQISDATPAEAARVANVQQGKTDESDLAIDSPRPWQVIQRRTKAGGAVRVSGHVKPNCETVEVRFTGKSVDGDLPDKWQPVTFDATTKAFNAELQTPAGGWYKVEVQAKVGDNVAAQGQIENVGVGEVFVIAGQSNSTNYGEKRQEPQSGLASTFDGMNWRPAADPQPGAHDNSTGGSPWPAFADAMAGRYHVPIGIACTGHGGTSVNAWQPGGELFRHTLARIDQLGYLGFRAVLWHQGESDSDPKSGMSTDEYAAKLANVIIASKRQAGWDFPWFVAQVSYHSPKEASFNNIREAQKRLWDEAIAFQGPDTDTLTGDNRDSNGAGIHLSEKGLRAHGKLWDEKVAAWLDKVLAAEK